MVAAADGHLSVAQFLVENRAEINTTNKYGNSPLVMAASRGHYDVVAFLVQNGAEIPAGFIKQYGNKFIKIASAEGYFECVKILVKNGADPSTPGCMSSSLEYYHNEVFNVLINEAGADISSVSVNCSVMFK